MNHGASTVLGLGIEISVTLGLCLEELTVLSLEKQSTNHYIQCDMSYYRQYNDLLFFIFSP